MTPTDWAVLSAFAFLVTCSSGNSWDDGYVPEGDKPSQSEDFLNPHEK